MRVCVLNRKLLGGVWNRKLRLIEEISTIKGHFVGEGGR